MTVQQALQPRFNPQLGYQDEETHDQLRSLPLALTIVSLQYSPSDKTCYHSTTYVSMRIALLYRSAAPARTTSTAAEMAEERAHTQPVGGRRAQQHISCKLLSEGSSEWVVLLSPCDGCRMVDP